VDSYKKDVRGAGFAGVSREYGGIIGFDVDKMKGAGYVTQYFLYETSMPKKVSDFNKLEIGRRSYKKSWTSFKSISSYVESSAPSDIN